MKLNDIVHDMPECECPFCGKRLDAASALDAGAKPEPGDVSVCFGCASPLRFDADLKLRVMPPAELASLPRKTRDVLNKAMAAIRATDRS